MPSNNQKIIYLKTTLIYLFNAWLGWQWSHTCYRICSSLFFSRLCFNIIKYCIKIKSSFGILTLLHIDPQFLNIISHLLHLFSQLSALLTLLSLLFRFNTVLVEQHLEPEPVDDLYTWDHGEPGEQSHHPPHPADLVWCGHLSIFGNLQKKILGITNQINWFTFVMMLSSGW